MAHEANKVLDLWARKIKLLIISYHVVGIPRKLMNMWLGCGSQYNGCPIICLNLEPKPMGSNDGSHFKMVDKRKLWRFWSLEIHVDNLFLIKLWFPLNTTFHSNTFEAPNHQLFMVGLTGSCKMTHDAYQTFLWEIC